jgi:very-short-patch-repair endonuclease
VGAPEKTVSRARALRKAMSLPEVLLWRELKGKPCGMKFRRQMGIGDFVADFACAEVRLLIEVDGVVHDMGNRPERDELRTEQLKSMGWQVVRIPAQEVLKDVKQVAHSIVIHASGLKNPPRNGEVARRSRDGGVETSPASAAHAASNRPLRPFGAPPRSGEDFAE